MDILRHSCRENHRLRIWHKPLDADDVLLETHVKHFVAFIQDLVLGAVYVETVVFKEVDQPAGSRYYNLRLDSSYVIHCAAKNLVIQNLVATYCYRGTLDHLRRLGHTSSY